MKEKFSSHILHRKINFLDEEKLWKLRTEGKVERSKGFPTWKIQCFYAEIFLSISRFEISFFIIVGVHRKILLNESRAEVWRLWNSWMHGKKFSAVKFMRVSLKRNKFCFLIFKRWKMAQLDKSSIIPFSRSVAILSYIVNFYSPHTHTNSRWEIKAKKRKNHLSFMSL